MYLQIGDSCDEETGPCAGTGGIQDTGGYEPSGWLPGPYVMQTPYLDPYEARNNSSVRHACRLD